MTATRAAGVLAAVSGALLVVALLLPWWGVPGDLIDPPAGAAGPLDFMAMGFDDPWAAEERWDGYEWFDFWDAVWLAAGVVGFAFGIGLLVVPRVPLPITVAVGALAFVAVVLIAIVLAVPPDYMDEGAEQAAEAAEAAGKEPRGEPDDFGLSLPFSREYGGFLALAAALGVTAAAALALVAGMRPTARTTGRSPRA
jgi:hypothetical protein